MNPEDLLDPARRRRAAAILELERYARIGGPTLTLAVEPEPEPEPDPELPAVDGHDVDDVAVNAEVAARFHRLPTHAQAAGWRDLATCAGTVDLMDARGGAGVAVALALCARCPVLDWCRSWVATEPHYEGVAAGRVWGRARKGRRVGAIQAPAGAVDAAVA